jgi:hypothetical protein
VVLSTNAEKIAARCHFCMMCVTCVKKGVFILILGPIDKNNLLVTSSFLYKYFLSSSSYFITVFDNLILSIRLATIDTLTPNFDNAKELANSIPLEYTWINLKL